VLVAPLLTTTVELTSTLPITGTGDSVITGTLPITGTGESVITGTLLITETNLSPLTTFARSDFDDSHRNSHGINFVGNIAYSGFGIHGASGDQSPSLTGQTYDMVTLVLYRLRTGIAQVFGIIAIPSGKAFLWKTNR
jgi:hypothetical protein